MKKIFSWLIDLYQHLNLLAKNHQFGKKLSYLLVVVGIVSGIATYVVLTGTDNDINKTEAIIPFLYFDLVVLLLLVIVIAKKLVDLWIKKKKGLAGSQIHTQFVTLFSFISVVPAIFMVIFASLFFNVGVKVWFSSPVRSALEETQAVSQAYLNEHTKVITHDAQAIIANLKPDLAQLINNRDLFSKRLSQEAQSRNLSEALVINRDQVVLARSYLTFALEFSKVSEEAFQGALENQIIILSTDNGDRVRALIKLDDLTQTYLYIGKTVDPAVLRHLHQTQGAVAEYNLMEEQRSGFQLTFILFFSLICLLLLLTAIWIGLNLAHFLVKPIGNLIEAAESVTKGKFDVQLAEDNVNAELNHLSRAFNQMTWELDKQRKDLIKANKTLDQRRQFTESVLSGVSAGVLGLDRSWKIFLPNKRAAQLLDVPQEKLQGQSLIEVVPEMKEIYNECLEIQFERFEQDITLMRKDVALTLQVRIVPSVTQTSKQAFVMTFDDVTPLLSAQRKAAWSDVARKIAHEIKNPLTPIQLSAERLKKKYLKEIQTDPEIFQNCIDTIIRQVGQIKNLVVEFSSFARMPEPIMYEENLVLLCDEALQLQKHAHANIEFEREFPKKAVNFKCDAQQFNQALTNLLQNAIDALQNQEINNPSFSPKIRFTLKPGIKQDFTISIEDNGPGFPTQGRERLLEPYYTTRAKGTGLGLAIVAKIVQDHGGQIQLGNSFDLGGACVVLSFSPIFKKGSIQ